MAPGYAPNVPPLQGLHVLAEMAASALEYVPDAHKRHVDPAVVPVPVWYVPAAHWLHELLPAKLEYTPDGQATQVAMETAASEVE